MNQPLILAYLFFMGSVAGWVIELIFRRFFSSANPERKWINPGFCTGPWVPLYGLGLDAMYLIVSLEKYSAFESVFATRAALFLAGAALLAIAYAMLLTRGILRVDALFWVMIGLGSLGTLLFFRSLSGFLLRICQSSKGLYYKNLNLFVLRQFNARINTTYRSMTVICLMLLLALGITASSVGLNNTVEQMTNQMSRCLHPTHVCKRSKAVPDQTRICT